MNHLTRRTLAGSNFMLIKRAGKRPERVTKGLQNNIDHDIYRAAVRQASSIFREYFPYHQVYPALGNHEGVPVDAFPPPEVWNRTKASSDWLFHELAADWESWLPEDCLKTVRKGGYYTTLVRKGKQPDSLKK